MTSAIVLTYSSLQDTCSRNQILGSGSNITIVGAGSENSTLSDRLAGWGRTVGPRFVN